MMEWVSLMVGRARLVVRFSVVHVTAVLGRKAPLELRKSTGYVLGEVQTAGFAHADRVSLMLASVTEVGMMFTTVGLFVTLTTAVSAPLPTFGLTTMLVLSNAKPVTSTAACTVPMVRVKLL